MVLAGDVTPDDPAMFRDDGNFLLDVVVMLIASTMGALCVWIDSCFLC
jgi:hypothetical protein